MARVAQSGVVHLDTHIVCWLYAGRIDLLSEAAAEAIEHARLVVSPIVDLELQLLHEIGRISKGPGAVLSALAAEIGLEVAAMPFSRVVAGARDLNWTRDPFDRLIVAQAMAAGAQLVTKDQAIRKNFAAALW